MSRRTTMVMRHSVLLCLLCAAAAFGDGPAEDARFYSGGRWRVENPVWDTWVEFSADGSYSVYEYVWKDNDRDPEEPDSVLNVDNPRIAVYTMETGLYEVTAAGLSLRPDVLSEADSLVAGEYTLTSYDFRWPCYALESRGQSLYSSVDYFPEAGRAFLSEGRPVVSMKGVMARARYSVEIQSDPGLVTCDEDDGPFDYSEVERLEDGWMVNVLLSTRADPNVASSVWYYIRIQLYPQAVLQGWVPAGGLELIQ